MSSRHCPAACSSIQIETQRDRIAVREGQPSCRLASHLASSIRRDLDALEMSMPRGNAWTTYAPTTTFRPNRNWNALGDDDAGFEAPHRCVLERESDERRSR